MMNTKKIAQIMLLIFGLSMTGWAYSYNYYVVYPQDKGKGQLQTTYPARLAKFKDSDWWSKLVPEGSYFYAGANQVTHISSSYGSIVLSQCDPVGNSCNTDIGRLSPDTLYMLEWPYYPNGLPQITPISPEGQKFEINFPESPYCSTLYVIRFQNVGDNSSNVTKEEPINYLKRIEFSYNRIEDGVFYPALNFYPNLYDKVTGQKVNMKLIDGRDSNRKEIPKTEGLAPGKYSANIQCPVAGHPAEMMVIN